MDPDIEIPPEDGSAEPTSVSTSNTVDEFPDPVIETDEGVEPSDAPPGDTVPTGTEGSVPQAAPLPPPPPQPDWQPPPEPQAPPYAPPPQPQYQQPQQPVYFTKAQLEEGVAQGLITDNQAVEIAQRQEREIIKQEALASLRAEQEQQKLKTELNRYSKLVPGWDVPGSPANVRATPAYNRLLSLNFPENDATRLLALEQTFGTPQHIESARATQTRTNALRGTPPPSGRRGAPPPRPSEKKDPVEILSPAEKQEYQSLIQRGAYRNWNEVREEIRTAASQNFNAKLKAKHAGLLR